jgi:hypothetical protein
MKRLLLIALLSLLALPSWAQVKISQMPGGGATANGDLVPAVRGGVNFKTTFSPVVSSGSAGAVQTSNGSGGFSNFLLSTTSGTGSATNGLLFNGGSTTTALSIGTNANGWTNQISPVPLAANALYQVSQGLLLDPRNYGASCDTQFAFGGAGFIPLTLGAVTFTASSPNVTISGYVWKTTDIGKVIAINAGFSGTAGVGAGTIIGIGPGGAYGIMSVSPTVSSSGGGVAVFGHDDSAAFVAAATAARNLGSQVLVPNNCGVRELTLPQISTLKGMSLGKGYSYTVDTPIMWVLATGFTEDSTSYGINITDAISEVFSGFTIHGPIWFPRPATISGYANEKLSLIGSDTGTEQNPVGYGSAVILDHLTLQNSFTCFGTRINLATAGGHIFFESHFDQFSECAWGMHGAFSDGRMTGDVFTSNNQGYGDAYWGQGSGFATTAMTLTQVRFEEGGGLYCDACSGNHLEGTEFQFEESDNAGVGGGGCPITLNGQWDTFEMTGGFLGPPGASPASCTGAAVRTTGFGNFGHPHATFVNVLSGGYPSFINALDNNQTPHIEYLGGMAFTDSFSNSNMAPSSFVAGTSTATFGSIIYEPENSKKYISGTEVTDFSINLNSALGLQTTSANLGSILDMGLASTTTNSSMILPNGSTANRPSTGKNGMVRYNTTIPAIEAFYNSVWNSLGPSTLGTTTTAANPLISGDATSGFYTAGAGKVDTVISGVKVAEFSSGGLAVTKAINAGLLTLAISGSAFATDASTANTFRVVLNGATITATNPTNPTDGQQIVYELVQDSSGSRVVSWGGLFDFGVSGAPTLSTGANKTDFVAFKYSANNTNWNYVGSQLGY